MCPKIPEAEIVISTYKADIVFVTETCTWLNHSIPDELVQIPNFNLVRRNRSSCRGGGVALYVRDFL